MPRPSSDPRKTQSSPGAIVDSGFEPVEVAEEESIGDEVAKTLAALMPWGVSIMFHLALIVLAFFIVWQTISQKQEQQESIPSTEIADNTPALKESAPTLDQSEASQENPFTTEVNIENTAIKPVFDIRPIQDPVQGIVDPARKPERPRHRGKDKGEGKDVDGPFDSGGNANKVVFVIDASGSMVDVLPFVVDELNDSIRKLEDTQQMSIVFFSGKGVFTPDHRGLVACTQDNKRDFRAWTSAWRNSPNAGGRGSAHVEKAITTALSYKPQLIFLLSDNLTGGGQGAGQHEIFQSRLLKVIQDHNRLDPVQKTAPAKFNTLQFIYPDPLVKMGLEGTLKKIAEKTGGEYRFISARRLNLQ